MGFNIMDLKRGKTETAKGRGCAALNLLKYIDVDDLVPSEDNFYSMSAIEELAGLIELSGGVKQPGLVTPLGGGKYRVIAGHRRRLASILLVNQGKEQYRKMPCMVEGADREPEDDEGELWDIDEAILLITTNGQREKTDWDRVQEAARLRELLDRKRKIEKISGETRKIIADWLGTTPAQVGRYESVARHLLPEFMRELESGGVNISVAYELSTMDEREQQKALDLYRKKEGLAIGDVKNLRDTLRRPPAEDLPRRKEFPKTDDLPKRTEPRHATNQAEGPELPRAADLSQKPETLSQNKNRGRTVATLERLKLYCDEMMAGDKESAGVWREYRDAITAAIGEMRR